MEEIDFTKTASELMSDKALETMMQYCVTFGKNILAALVIYFVGRFIISKLTRLLRAIMQKKQIEPSLYSFLDSLVTFCLHFVRWCSGHRDKLVCRFVCFCWCCYWYGAERYVAELCRRCYDTIVPSVPCGRFH